MENQVDEIKNRLDLVDLVRSYMKLDKSGINFRGLCPFHREKTPSFFVSPTRQLWRCFGCSQGGDMFTFIQQIEGVDFKEALKTLADKAGVHLRSYDPRERSEKARLYEICEKSCQFFEKQLMSSALGGGAKEYLTARGIREESMKKFRIGFAPQTRNSLSEFLRAQGYSATEIFKAGVTIQPVSEQSSAAPGQYDRFRGRIIFPICDLNSQVIGFGGRVFFSKNQVPDSKLAKYINTPQTLLYDKSKTLYGLDKARLKIRETENCVLVEGYTDVIMAHQAGTENVVAVSGTSLTEQQLDIIRRYTENLFMLFDMDIAGDTATKRGIALAQRKGFQIKVITLPEGKDPAEIIQKSERKWKKAIEKPLSIGDFYFQNAFSRFDKKTPEGIRNIQNIVLPMIKQIPSQIEQSFWVQKLASELLCGEQAVWDELKKIPVPSAMPAQTPAHPSASGSEITTLAPRENTQTATGKKMRRDVLYDRMLLLVLTQPQCSRTLRKKDLSLFQTHSIPASAVLKLRTKQQLTPGEKEFVDAILFQEEIFPTLNDETTVQGEFQLCLQTLTEITLREQLLKLQQELKHDKKDEALLEEFQKVSMKLARLC